MSVPSAPIIRLAPRSSNQTLEFQWSPPASGSPITGYEIDIIGTGGGTYTTTGTYYKQTGLTNGTLYTATVRAQNSNGYGPTASFRPFAPGNGVPGQPATATAVSLDGYTSAMVSWTAPSSLPDSPIFWYVITSSSSNGSDPVIKRTANGLTQTSLKITGLNPASTYTFSVRAVNCPGYGPATTTTSVGPPTKGSVSFDVGDYFSMSPGITPGTGDFSVDGWIYFTTPLVLFNSRFIIGGTGFPSFLFLSAGNSIGNGGIFFGPPTSTQQFTVPSFADSTWYYFAIARSGTDTTAWLGTTPGGTATRSSTGVVTNSTDYNVVTNSINYSGSSSTEITITNLRIQVGASLFNPANSTIPIPSTNTTADGNTKLLLLETSVGNLLTDTSGTQTLTSTGTPTWSSSTPYP